MRHTLCSCEVLTETSSYGFLCIYLQLIVYGAGQVIPSSLTVLEPNLKYTLLVGLYPNAFLWTCDTGNGEELLYRCCWKQNLKELPIQVSLCILVSLVVHSSSSFLEPLFAAFFFKNFIFSALSSIRRFKPNLYFYLQPVVQHICFCCDICLCKFDKAYDKTPG